MPEHHPEHDPGHLDIDAVSAFVDQDFASADLAAIEIHLRRCPACDREVLEIRTTVTLLAGLPEYAPRRSFCLGQEYARAARRKGPGRPATSWTPPPLSSGNPGPSTTAMPFPAASGAGWLPGLQVAALVVGAMLLLVTAGDLTGFTPDAAPLQLAAPTALAETPSAPMAAMPAPQPASESASMAADSARVQDGIGESESAPSERVAAFQQESAATGGTERDSSASDEIPAPAVAATSAAMAVTQAIPTPGAAIAPAGDETAGTAAPLRNSGSDEQPSRMRIVQLALALLLAWLIVSIAGLRWVRRTR